MSAPVSGDMCSFGRKPEPAHHVTHYRCDEFPDGTVTDARTGEIIHRAPIEATRQWWTFEDAIAWHETDDPRVLAVIQLDDSGDTAPYGDGLAPAYFVESSRDYWGAKRIGSQVGTTYSDESAANRWAEATERAPFRATHYVIDPVDFADRYMRIFHDTSIVHLSDRDSDVMVLNTPAFREHVGMTDVTVAGIEDERVEFQAWLDGEVYGVGYAINEARTTTETEIELDDFEVTMECWGLFGADHAKESALSFEHGSPGVSK